MQNLRHDWRSLAQRLHGRVWRLRSDVKVALARRTGAEIGEDCILDPGAEAWHGLMRARRGRISMGAHCQLERGALLHPWGGSIRLGCNVFLGPYAVVYGHGGVEIGDQTLIAMHSPHPLFKSCNSTAGRRHTYTAGRDVADEDRSGCLAWRWCYRIGWCRDR